MKITTTFPLLVLAAIVAPIMSGQQTTVSSGRPPTVINGFAIPQRSQGTGGGCQLQGPLLRIPSKAGGEEGIVVRASPPVRPRYPEGAPVAVQFSVGDVDGAPACLNEAGFIDIAGLCPGTQSRRQPDGSVWKSGGAASPEPKACTEAFADVLAFATGRLRSTEGKSIQDYISGMKALTQDAGAVGWSMGGVIAVEAIARYGERFPGLKWYASWESPFAVESLDEGSALKANRFYDPKTGTIDFKTLRYMSDLPVHYFPLAIAGLPPEARAFRGSLVLDGGPHGPEATYPLQAEFRRGPPSKVFYSSRVTEAASEGKIFGDGWPTHIATPEEAEQLERNEAQELVAPVKTAVSKFPNLAVLVFQSAEDHVNDDAGYARAIAQINAFLDAGVRWVRLNPDVHYVEWAMKKQSSKRIQNPAGKRFTAASVRDAVEPEDRDGGPTDKAGMTAAAAELSDRTWRRDWSPTLAAVLAGAAGSDSPEKN
jgi:hypothetical protein